VAAKENQVAAAAETRGNQLVPLVQAERDDSARHRIVELGELALLDDPVARHHHDVLLRDKILHGEEGLTLSSGCR